MLQCRLNSIRATLSNFAHSCQFSIIPQRQPLDLDFFAVEKWMSYCLHPVLKIVRKRKIRNTVILYIYGSLMGSKPGSTAPGLLFGTKI